MKEILLTSGVLILLLTALRPLLRGRISARLQYALWLLAALRLLLPVSLPGTALSVLNLVPDAAPVSAVQEVIVRPAAPAEAPVSDVPASPLPSSETAPAPAVSPAAPAAPARAAVSPPQALTALWLAGTAGMAVWFLAVNLSFRRRARRSARQVEVPDCPLPVYVSEGIPSPCLLGLLRPAVYVTPACAEGLRLRHVLAHELTHRRHGDAWWSLLRGVCLCLYWFDPLVWWAAALSRRDCELACDEGAIRLLGEDQRIAYGRTLVDMAALSASPACLLHTATSMAETKQSLSERVRSIASRPQLRASALFLTAAIAVVAVCATFTGARKPAVPAEATPALQVLDLSAGQPYTADDRDALRVLTDFVWSQGGDTLHACLRLADGQLVLLTSEQGFHEEEGRFEVIDCAVYTVRSGEVLHAGSLGSSGTNYPISCDGTYLFSGGGLWTSKSALRGGALVTAESASEQFDKNGVASFTRTLEGRDVPAVEGDFRRMFAEYGAAAPVRFQPLHGADQILLERTVTVNGGKELRLSAIGREDTERGLWGVREIYVYDEDGLYQTISVRESAHAEEQDTMTSAYTECPDRELVLDAPDMNFDGSADIALYGFLPNNSVPYYYWLWDGTVYRYAYTLQGAEPHPDTKEVTSWYKVENGVYYTDHYRYDANGRLTLSSRDVEDARTGDSGAAPLSWAPPEELNGAVYVFTGEESLSAALAGTVDTVTVRDGSLPTGLLFSVYDAGAAPAASPLPHGAGWLCDLWYRTSAQVRSGEDIPAEGLRELLSEDDDGGQYLMSYPEGMQGAAWQLQQTVQVWLYQAVLRQPGTAPVRHQLYPEITGLTGAALTVRNAMRHIFAGELILQLDSAGGPGGGAHPFAPDRGNGPNRSLWFPIHCDWSYAEAAALPEGRSLQIQSADGLYALTVWEDSDLVLYTAAEREIWLRDSIGSSFAYWRMLYDEAEWFDLWDRIVIPDRGQSQLEIAQSWVDAECALYLQMTPGSQYACTYSRGVASIKEGFFTGRETFLAGREWFTFSYVRIFVPENDDALNWQMAGNTEGYTGQYGEAPEGALSCWHVGPMYRTEEGWRCNGAGTG